MKQPRSRGSRLRRIVRDATVFSGSALVVYNVLLQRQVLVVVSDPTQPFNNINNNNRGDGGAGSSSLVYAMLALILPQSSQDNSNNDIPHMNLSSLLIQQPPQGRSKNDSRSSRRTSNDNNNNSYNNNNTAHNKRGSSTNTDNSNDEDDDDKSLSRTTPTIDIISIGSHMQPDLQLAQSETMGSHPAVRYFYKATEDDDSEMDCHRNLTWSHVQQVSSFCKRRAYWPPILRLLRANYANTKWLSKKQNPVGWMCAQKRPVDALLNAAKRYQYRTTIVQDDDDTTTAATSSSNVGVAEDGTYNNKNYNNSNLPDYLIIADDDTWINVDNVMEFVPHAYPVNKPCAVAGCMIRSRIHEHNFTFGFGGYGLILNRQALYNFFRPLNCSAYHYDSSHQHLLSTDTTTTTTTNVTPPPFTVAPKEMMGGGEKRTEEEDDDDEDFEKLACWRLAQNGIGERPLFRNGMSVADLMQAYNSHAPYQKVSEWGSGKNNTTMTFGFCLHSDWMFGYFINYYHLSLHTTAKGGCDGDHDPYYNDVLHNRLQGYNQSTLYTGRFTNVSLLRECLHAPDMQHIALKQQQGTTTNAAKTATSVVALNATTLQNGNAFCEPNAHFCHRITSSHMRYLYETTTQQKQQQQYNRNHHHT